ncbi:MAG: 50S ribosomal protein L5 [Patescibacteria group bacterium]
MEDLKEKFNKEVIDEMVEEFDYDSTMAVPRLEKVSINVGIGERVKDKSSDKQKEIIDYFVRDIGLIAGQKPVVTKAKKSIAGFNIRKGDPVGVKVTLRDEKMNNFVEKMVNLVFPGLRDFRGLNPDSVDDSGNLTIGVEEHISFPEIPADDRDDIFSLQVTITNTAENKEEGLALFQKLDFPFKK